MYCYVSQVVSSLQVFGPQFCTHLSSSASSPLPRQSHVWKSRQSLVQNTNYAAYHAVFFSPLLLRALLCQNILVWTVTFLCSTLNMRNQVSHLLKRACAIIRFVRLIVTFLDSIRDNKIFWTLADVLCIEDGNIPLESIKMNIRINDNWPYQGPGRDATGERCVCSPAKRLYELGK
jgi:hypothetical protein